MQASHCGPFLIRASSTGSATSPTQEDRSLVRTVEIVEDIAKCAGLDLAPRFQAATTPCIIKFRTTCNAPPVLHSVFWYLHGMLHDGAPGWLSYCDYDGGGRPVPPGDIVAVELLQHS
jgi:hypothetical protein